MKLRHLFFTIACLSSKGAFPQNDSKDYYTPKALIIPLHDQRNQLHTSFGRGGGFDLNVSYAFTDKFAVFTTSNYDIGMKKRSTILGSTYKIDKNDYSLRGGLGYFTKFNNKILEAYIGGGHTRIDNYWFFTEYPEGGEVTQADYNTVFVQFNSGKKRTRSDLALGIRLAYSMYSNFRFSDRHPNTRAVKSRYENAKGLTIDPAVSYSYKLKKIRFNAQAGFAFPLSRNSATQIDEHITDRGTTVISSQDDIALSAILGRLSIQYDFHLK